MKPSDLPSPEAIASLSKVRPNGPKQYKAGQKRSRDAMRKKRKAWRDAGLTSEGKVRVNISRPELKGITDRAKYTAAWRKLVGGKTKKK